MERAALEILADGSVAARAYDAAVDASPDLDRFCCQRAFVVAAFEGLQPGRTARVASAGTGWLAFAERRAAIFGDPRPRVLWEPLEAMWGLCCPLVGDDPAQLVLGLAERLDEAPERPVLLICGLRRDSPRLHALRALEHGYRFLEGTPTVRHVASLAGGLDGFFARRSPAVRRGLRRADAHARKEGVRYERHAPRSRAEADALYARAVALDDASWKGRAAEGLRASGLHAFYACMLPLLAEAGALRVGFLVDDAAPEPDLAYLFGGVLHDTFRGLQFAFRAGEERRSLGNLVQLREITALCDEGITRYDLGTAADYKRHWAEQQEETLSVIAVPRSAGAR